MDLQPVPVVNKLNPFGYEILVIKGVFGYIYSLKNTPGKYRPISMRGKYKREEKTGKERKHMNYRVKYIQKKGRKGARRKYYSFTRVEKCYF